MGVRQWLSRQINPEQVADKSGIDPILRIGMLGERLDNIKGLDDDSLIKFGAQYATAILPWLDLRKDRDMRRKCMAFLSLNRKYEYRVKMEEALGDKFEGIANAWKLLLVPLAKFILGLSFQNPDDNKTIVISKPIILNPNQMYGGPPNPRDSQIPFRPLDKPQLETKP